MNLLLWSAALDEGLIPVLESLREIGYDGVEIPLFVPDIDYAAWGKRLDDLGLERTAVTIRSAADSPISNDSATRDAGVAATNRDLDNCASVGATHLVGPFHSALGHFSGQGPTSDEWKWGVESMRKMAHYAESLGIVLAIEALNRFECYFLNAVSDAMRFVREVDHPNCGVIYDTFHAHIEEKDAAGAVNECADALRHVHISENDRSTPGSGSIRWDEVFDALREAEYDGWMTIEAFGLALPEVAAATKIWRRMYDTEELLAKEGLAFMKSEVEKRW